MLDHAKKLQSKPVILDCWCGAGGMVQTLINNNFNAYGCDVVLRSDNKMVKEMNDQCQIPYEDKMFDLILSNQVIEHVHDLEIMLEEFSRVYFK